MLRISAVERCWGPAAAATLCVRNNGAAIKVEMTVRHLANGSLEDLLCAACFLGLNGGVVGSRVPRFVRCNGGKFEGGRLRQRPCSSVGEIVSHRIEGFVCLHQAPQNSYANAIRGCC